MEKKDREEIFLWALRALGIGTFIVSLVDDALSTERMIMCAAFFWGPDLLRGKLRLMFEKPEEPNGPAT